MNNFYELYTGIDGLASNRQTLMKEKKILVTEDKELVLKEYERANEKAKELSENVKNKRYYTYIIEVIPDMPLGTENNKCASYTIKEANYYNGREIR